MSDIIHLLPDAVANQIAAGEVIQRPASVLKELVENSIDAGATSITIIVKDGGKTLLQVSDNGKGMSQTDARMAFERHATSKINAATDLFSLRTFGFRGEALASIASVAQVEMRTRRSDDELGTLLEITGSNLVRNENVAANGGTSISVRNLFFNIPARRRFLKSDNYERMQVINEFYRIALVNCQVEFVFFDNDSEIFRLPPSNIKQRIENIFGKNQKKNYSRQLLDIDTNTTLVKITGFVSLPEFAQKSANQYFFVNGRYMRHPYFNKAVMMAYSNLLKNDENPNYFIYFDVEPDSIDINIHPTKTEIKFENEQAVWSILSATVKETLGKFVIAPSIDFDREGAIDIPINRAMPTSVQMPTIHVDPNYNPFKTNNNNNRPSDNWEKLYSGFESNKTQTTQNFDNESTQDNLLSQKNEWIAADQNPEVHFQFKSKYIVCSTISGLLFIHQHRAHVNILYHNFITQISNHKAPSQQLLFPETLQIAETDIAVFAEMQNDLKYIGFDINSLDKNQYEITGIPSIFSSESVLPVIEKLLADAKLSDQKASTSISETIALSLAQSGAIRTGQALSTDEMESIVTRLLACKSPNYTPDGKQILMTITSDEIQAKFK
ncbi:MAG: DNA mismatch repair endonuclease MutL [Paludibacter sp.]|jgi:DNA mismatch repair protein MutL|nr:DNA mismatch repair endonuclease MutL [Paludibacter sp.]